MSEPRPHFRAVQSFGGIFLSISVGPHKFADLDIADEDLPHIVEQGLRRLAGQGKIPTTLHDVCSQVSQLPEKDLVLG